MLAIPKMTGAQRQSLDCKQEGMIGNNLPVIALPTRYEFIDFGLKLLVHNLCPFSILYQLMGDGEFRIPLGDLASSSPAAESRLCRQSGGT